MNDKNLHIDIFSKGKITWEKSKEEIWEDMFSHNQDFKPNRTIPIRRLISFGVAATLAILIGISSVLWFWTTTITCPTGEHLTAQLPDGSTVEMNASSEIKYYPYRWAFSRDIIFEGEGFFKVEKGKRFEVSSENAKTSVLGTSFNIYSRGDLYRVSCMTGKVRVTSSNKESVILSPNQQVILKQGEELKKLDILKTDEIISWRNNKFLFRAAPFHEVINEIERQYGVVIRVDKGQSGILTCNFTRKSDVEEVLALVCKPLGYKFVRQAENNYIILPQNKITE